MKSLVSSFAFGLATLLIVGCAGPKPSDSTLNASGSRSFVDGSTKIRVVAQHDYVSLQLKGEELFKALWNYLKITATVEGEDGDYYSYKTSDELSCGGANVSSEGDLENFEDPSCEIKLSLEGKAGVKSDDPWAWANAAVKSEDIATTVSFANGKAHVRIHPSVDTHILWDAMTGLAVQDEEDEELQHKRGDDLRIDYEYADGDDFVGLFEISNKGLLRAE